MKIESKGKDGKAVFQITEEEGMTMDLRIGDICDILSKKVLIIDANQETVDRYEMELMDARMRHSQDKFDQAQIARDDKQEKETENENAKNKSHD